MGKGKVGILTKPTARDLIDINALISQIAERPHLLTMRELKRIVDQKKNCRLVVMRDHIGKRIGIVGMATVTLTHIPTGLVALVEDVVVDEAFRGKGIGKKLIHALIAIAEKEKAKHISLYTNPKRAAANAMYQEIGFFKKETNYYRINLLLPKPATADALKKNASKRKRLS